MNPSEPICSAVIGAADIQAPIIRKFARRCQKLKNNEIIFWSENNDNTRLYLEKEMIRLSDQCHDLTDPWRSRFSSVS